MIIIRIEKNLIFIPEEVLVLIEILLGWRGGWEG